MVSVFVVPLLLVLFVGVLLMRAQRNGRRPGPLSAFAHRTRVAYGRVGGAAVTVAAGAGLLLLVMWPLGYLARNLEHQDRVAYAWVGRHNDVHWLTGALRLLTKMGNNRESQVLVVVAAVVLTVLWWRRGRGLVSFVPAVVLAVAYEYEHQLQHTLKLLAHRGHPPLSLGSYPSGGCARLELLGGLTVYLLLRAGNLQRGRLGVAAGTLVACAAWVEAYSRVYLLKHWLSDVVAGVIFGGILLAVLVGVVMILDSPTQAGAPRGRPPRRHAAVRL